MKSIHEAAEEGDIEAIQIALDSQVSIETKDEIGYTALHLAAEKAQLGAVKFLLDQGAAIDSKNDSQQSPLHLAAYSGHTCVANLLIVRGADVSSLDYVNRTPLHDAEDGSLTEHLIARGANIEARDDLQTTPLHLAVCRANGSGDINCVKVLLQYGASHTPIDVNEESPFDHCRSVSLESVVQKLMTDYPEQPCPSLQTLCKRSIRKQLIKTHGTASEEIISNQIGQLPLPVPLKNYLQGLTLTPHHLY